MMADRERSRGRGRSCIRTPSAASIASTNTLHHAPRRATSHHIQSNVDHKTNEDLRHTALRKGLSRTSSASTLETEKHKRHDRWSGYSIASAERVEDKKQKASISPLTHIHNQAEAVNERALSEKLLSERLSEKVGDKLNETLDRFERNDRLPNERTDRIQDRFSNERFERNSSDRLERRPDSKNRTSLRSDQLQSTREDHNSMFSLVPMSRSHTESEDSMDDAGPEPQRGVFPTYEQDFEPGLENITSMLDFMKEVESRPRAPERAKVETERSTRTHQKVLQMKDFLKEDSGSETPGPSFGNSFDYAVKIQHESLVSQWDQVRFRFSSYSSRKNRTTVTCSAGVLGSVQRLKKVGFGGEKPGEMVTRDTLAEYLQSMWQEDEVTEDYRAEDEDIYSDGPREMSNLARNVVFGK